MREANVEAGKQDALPLLLEIGCEEIPAHFLRDAERGLGELVQKAISEARLLPGPEVGAVREPPLQTYSTPRRLVVCFPAVLTRQPDRVEEILGPPVKVAVNAEGKYTRAAVSFAQKNSAHLEDLARTTTPKGEYLALRKTTQGRAASAVLAEILPAAILRLGFPKSMYWLEKAGPRFVRPIRWVLAILGEGKQAEAVNFEVLGVRSGDFTFGHRVYSKGPITMTSFNDYGDQLRRAFVEIDPEQRRQTLRTRTNALLEDSLVLVEDSDLEEWLVNSTEWPSAIRGGFDGRFLQLPREILITVMRDHQKYFAVENPQGILEPYFLAVLNVDSDERGLIRQGHERVLQARFSDAVFFWDADQRMPLRDRMARLEKVTYQAELGSYADKVRRMHAIAARLSEKLEAQGILEAGQREQVLRAVELSKCDLTTQMVQEFAELQGVVGGLYAKAQGELEGVATAIYDHYLPQGVEDKCLRTAVGALVSLADKLDAVVAGFAVGNGPTGSSDPFAIRRQANGVIKVLLDISASIDMDSEIVLELAALREKLIFESTEVAEAVRKFMRERLTFHLETVVGLRYDTIRAAMGARQSGLEPAQVLVRAKAIERIRSSDDFLSLSQSAKRIRNILSKSAQPSDFEGRAFDAERLEAGPEQDLYAAYERVHEEAAEKRTAGDIHAALECIASLRAPVDLFFDKVLVMADDPEVRRNRLQLLIALDRLFTEDADLSQIEKANVDAPTSQPDEAKR
ncbi:MAG: glycine--tRNA ligase subunit beta [Terriglobia bacterium]